MASNAYIEAPASPHRPALTRAIHTPGCSSPKQRGKYTNVRTSFIEPLHKHAQERVVHGVFRYGGDGTGRVARDRLGSDATARPAQLLPRHVNGRKIDSAGPRYWGRDCRDA